MSQGFNLNAITNIIPSNVEVALLLGSIPVQKLAMYIVKLI